MKNSPFIVSLLIGLIVVLVIGGVSLLAKINSLSVVYKKELAENINSAKNLEDLKTENDSLKKGISQLNAQIGNTEESAKQLEVLKNESVKQAKQIESLKAENRRLASVNKNLENNLKAELMKSAAAVK